MNIRKILALGLATTLLVAACAGAASPSPSRSATPASPTPLAVDPAKAVIQSVEPNAEITF